MLLMTKLLAAGLTAVIAALAVWGTRRLVRARAETFWVAMASALWFAELLIVAASGEDAPYSDSLLRLLVLPSALHNACLVAAAAAIARAAPVDPTEWAAVQDSKLIACTALEHHVFRWVAVDRNGAVVDAHRRLNRLLARTPPSKDLAVVYVTPALLGWEEYPRLG